MGSDIHLIVVAGHAGLLDEAAARLEMLESRWSRFRVESEICRLNRHAGSPLVVSGDTQLLVTRAIEAWRLTGGGFDPTLLDDLIRAGYDRSFADIGTDSGDPAQLPMNPLTSRVGLDHADCTDIVVDGDSVTIPTGIAFDPGGIGKGLAADLVAALLIERGARGACVNMGGDVRVTGAGPDGGGWTLAIEHPLAVNPVVLVGVSDGAVATSSVLRRTWSVGGTHRHHLIDPATGLPSDTDLGMASVIAGTAWEAEVLAKAVLLRGCARAFDLLEHSVEALVVDRDGRVNATPGFQSFVGDAAVPARLVFDREPSNGVGNV